MIRISLVVITLFGTSIADAAPPLPSRQMVAWVKYLLAGDGQRRASAAADLGRLGPTASPAVPLLAFSVERDQEAIVRREASHALGLIVRAPNARVRDVLFQTMLHDDARTVRLAASSALASMARFDSSIVPILIEPFGRPWERIRGLHLQHAIDSFAEIGPACLPVLSEAMADPEKRRIRIAGAKAIAKMGPDAKAAVPLLIEMLDDGSNDEVVMAACLALWKIGPAGQDAATALAELIENGKYSTPAFAALALSSIDPTNGNALQYLTDLRNSKKGWHTELAPAFATVRPRDSEWQDALRNCLGDDDWRNHALEAITRIGPTAAILESEVAELLDYDDLQTRYWAAIALSRITGRTSDTRLAAVMSGAFASDQTSPVDRKPVYEELARFRYKAATDGEISLGDCRTGFTFVSLDSDTDSTHFAISAALNRTARDSAHLRVRAIGVDNRVFEPTKASRSTGLGADLGVVTIVCEFDLPESDIKMLVVERRKTR